MKHRWTDEERLVVRNEYQGTRVSATLIAAELSHVCGERITTNAVKGQIQNMGIAINPRTVSWSPDEEERLATLITTLPVYKVAKALGRSKVAVKLKAKRMGISLRFRDGWFTKKEVCGILGVDHHRVQLWIDSRELKASWHGETKPQKNGGSCWHIDAKDMSNFIRSHAYELTGRNVDLFMIVELLAGTIYKGANGS